MKHPTICLVMIACNESAVIARALESAKPVIDTWCIVDTGSTDGTPEIIREVMRGIPGEIHHRPWVDFGHNRTEALDGAKGYGAEYFLILDADDILEMEKPAELSEPAYMLEIVYGDMRYHRPQLVQSNLNWRYVGPLHEYIHNGNSDELNAIPLPDAKIHITREGARAKDPDRYKKDAEILERALLAEPENDRYVFYLAQSYKDSGQVDKAIEAYKRRSGMGGWEEEVWYSRYRVADLYARQDLWDLAVQWYLWAYDTRPTRAEPLYKLGKYYASIQHWETATLFMGRAAEVPYPERDRLFIERAVYDYLIQIELAVCLHYLDEPEQASAMNEDLLDSGSLPVHLVALVRQNRALDLARMTAAA